MVKKSKILRISFEDIILVHPPEIKKIEECFKQKKKQKKQNE